MRKIGEGLDDLVVPETVVMTTSENAPSLAILARSYQWPMRVFGSGQRAQAFDHLKSHSGDVALFVTDSQGCGEVNIGGIETDYLHITLARDLSPQTVSMVVACCDHPDLILRKALAAGLVDSVIFDAYGLEYIERITQGYQEARNIRDTRFFTGA